MKLELTQSAVAHAIGIGDGTQHRREVASISFPVEDLIRYAKVYGCTPEEIVAEAREPYVPPPAESKPPPKRPKRPVD
jgi:hypothetical protein